MNTSDPTPDPTMAQDMQEIAEHAATVRSIPSLERLSLREFTFVTVLVETGNKTAAIQAAGYARNVTGTVLLQRLHIQEAYADLLALRKAERLHTLEQVIESLIDDAFFDPIAAYDAAGQPKRLQDMDGATRQRITGYKTGRYGIELTFVERHRAKELLLGILGATANGQGMTVTINMGEGTGNTEQGIGKRGIQAGQFTLQM